MDTIRAFFPKISAHFLIFKKGQGRPPPLPLRSCVPEKGDDKSYFTCGHEEHLLLAVIYTYIHLRAFQYLLNNIQLLKKSFNTEGQGQNIAFKAINISTVVNITI